MSIGHALAFATGLIAAALPAYGSPTEILGDADDVAEVTGTAFVPTLGPRWPDFELKPLKSTLPPWLALARGQLLGARLNEDAHLSLRVRGGKVSLVLSVRLGD